MTKGAAQKRESITNEPLDKSKRLKIVSDLASINGVTKSGLSKTLKRLYDQGLLVDALVSSPTSRSYSRQVFRAFDQQALHEHTPYGIMLNEKELPIDESKKENKGKRATMYYINPFALLFKLCAINGLMFGLVKDAVRSAPNRCLRILMYIDEINPGNPVAPDPQKLLQAVYWCIIELPTWFLRRKDAWFCFTITRSINAKRLASYVSELMKHTLHAFFPEAGDSFKRGCTLQHGSDSISFVASFAGILADEKGLKEVFGIKGQAGNAPCFNCFNIRNRWVTLTEGMQHMWDPDTSKRVPMTNAHITTIQNRLANASSQTRRQEIQTKLGINFIPSGFLWCPWLLANVIDPTENYIRDWMHTLVSGGVAGTHLALLYQALAERGCGVEIVRAFSLKFSLPRSRGGRVSDLFFKSNLVDTDQVRHFASDVLGMIPLMWAFLMEKIKHRMWLPSNIECFRALYVIVCILRRGEMTIDTFHKLQERIVQHAKLFLDLYGEINAKVKFHHLYHLAEDMMRLGKSISCFPGERKNKDALALSVACDRNIERSSTIAFLHRTITHWSGNSDGCSKRYMHSTRFMMVQGDKIGSATSATTECGDLYANDMVYLVDGSIASIIDFWQHDGQSEIFVRMKVHQPIPHTEVQFHLDTQDAFQSVNTIVEAVAWYRAPSHVVACVPQFC